MTEQLKRTSLYSEHLKANGRLVPFAGWEMPVQYTGIREEHMAVRQRTGIFDVSHMGQIETSGPQALDFLQRILSNDVSAIPLGGAQYSVLCLENGGVIDDLFTYRLAEDRYLTVTNASNHEKDLAWFLRWADGYDVKVDDRCEDFAMIAVQGPQARALLTELADSELPARMTVQELQVAGKTALVCGTGYTGEDGAELLVAPQDAPHIWQQLLAAGAEPVGLGARDTLRLEVCYHLYGNDLMESRGPIEAGLGWCCKEQTGFIGAEAVAAVRNAGPEEKLVPFVMTDPGIARQGNLLSDGGEVTSGTMSPSLGVGIGMAYVPTAQAQPGETVKIDVRGKVRCAEIKKKPLYNKED